MGYTYYRDGKSYDTAPTYRMRCDNGHEQTWRPTGLMGELTPICGKCFGRLREVSKKEYRGPR